MDTLTLKGLQYRAHHGYYEKERKKGNDFEVDLIFKASLQSAGTKDDLNLTIDYEQAEEIVRKVMEGPSVKLIETLARKIGEQLFKDFKVVKKLTVTVRKLNPPLQTATDYSEIRMSWPR